MREIMKNFGYNFPEGQWKEHLIAIVKLIIIGATMTLPLLAAMALAGWMDSLSGL